MSDDQSPPRPAFNKKASAKSSKSFRSIGKRASFLLKSFRKSGGERGADCQSIRGETGADFEHAGTIARQGTDSCICFGGKVQYATHGCAGVCDNPFTSFSSSYHLFLVVDTL
mmetsp:Transcript_22946/g.53180  ORF Transcript_22946/g.53180 Transcript_22946/m.53180 type:complete len:113 (-) Transcript_22946:2554-2892(-)